MYMYIYIYTCVGIYIYMYICISNGKYKNNIYSKLTIDIHTCMCKTMYTP